MSRRRYPTPEPELQPPTTLVSQPVPQAALLHPCPSEIPPEPVAAVRTAIATTTARACPRRRSKSRSKRSNEVRPADAAEFVTTLMDMRREVLAGLAAGVLATLGSVALALLKVALWVVIVAGVALFGVLFIVGVFVVGRWTLLRMTGTDDSAAGQATETTRRIAPISAPRWGLGYVAIGLCRRSYRGTRGQWRRSSAPCLVWAATRGGGRC